MYSKLKNDLVLSIQPVTKKFDDKISCTLYDQQQYNWDLQSEDSKFCAAYDA